MDQPGCGQNNRKGVLEVVVLGIGGAITGILTPEKLVNILKNKVKQIHFGIFNKPGSYFPGFRQGCIHIADQNQRFGAF